MNAQDTQAQAVDITDGHGPDCRHDSAGWSQHNAWLALSETARTQVMLGRAAMADLRARDAAVPGSGRNGSYSTAQGTGIAPTAVMMAGHRAVNASARMRAALGITYETSPAHPVTLSAVVARRRNVRRGRYANAQVETVRLDGVAYASNGDQVLSETAIAWSERERHETVRSGHCDAPVMVIDQDGRATYAQPVSVTAQARKYRKTPETAIKEIRRAIENVAVGKRPEGWARDRLTRYAELIDVDVFDGLVDALDDALVNRAYLSANESAGVLADCFECGTRHERDAQCWELGSITAERV